MGERYAGLGAGGTLKTLDESVKFSAAALDAVAGA